MGIIIYGPQGCGKSINKKLIAKAYGKAVIIDDCFAENIPNDSIAFTNIPTPNAISFSSAIAHTIDMLGVSVKLYGGRN